MYTISKKKCIYTCSHFCFKKKNYFLRIFNSSARKRICFQVRLRAVDTEMFLDLLIFRREKKFKENIWLNVLYHTQGKYINNMRSADFINSFKNVKKK